MYNSTKPQSSWEEFLVEPQLPFECLGVLWMEVESVFWVAEKMSLSFSRGYSGGQKCCHLFSGISKTSDLFPPTPNKVEFWANGWNDCFFCPQHCWGEWRDDRMNPKKIKKIVISSRVLRNNHLEGLFHTVPNSLIFVLHCRTVPSIEETNTRIILYEHTFFSGPDYCPL